MSLRRTLRRAIPERVGGWAASSQVWFTHKASGVGPPCPTTKRRFLTREGAAEDPPNE